MHKRRAHVFDDSRPVLDWIEENHPELHKELSELGVKVADATEQPEDDEGNDPVDIPIGLLNNKVKEALVLYRTAHNIVVSPEVDEDARGPRAHLVRSYYYPPYYGYDMDGNRLTGDNLRGG